MEQILSTGNITPEQIQDTMVEWKDFSITRKRWSVTTDTYKIEHDEMALEIRDSFDLGWMGRRVYSRLLTGLALIITAHSSSNS